MKLPLLLFLLLTTAATAQDRSWFKDVTTSVGLDSIVNYFVYVSDVNGDDYPDILLEAGAQKENQLRLFINTPRPGTFDARDRIFVERTKESGVNAPGRIADLAAMADVNNDGAVDIVTATYYYDSAIVGEDKPCVHNPDNGGRCEVLLNNGTGRFTLLPNNGLHELGPIAGSALSFLDYDRDGNIDLFIGTHYRSSFCNGEGARKYLMRGRGDGTFADVTKEAGLLSYTEALFGSNVGDWNNDCRQDILTSIYAAEGRGNLWRNNGNGTFTDVAEQVGYDPHFMPGDKGRRREGPGQPMVPWAAEPYDFDNDGDMDVLFVLVHGGADSLEGRSTLFINSGPPNYTLTPELDRIVRLPPQSSHHGDNQGRFFDMENDGLADLALTECVYIPKSDRLFLLHQKPDHRFIDVTRELGFITGDSASDISDVIRRPHAIEPIDVDLDGDDDLIVAKYPEDKHFVLLRNEIGSRNNWIGVKLVAPSGVNRSSIGARIRVVAGDLKMTRDIYAGQGNFGGQQPFILNFGLDWHREVDTIEVRWPDAACSRTIVTRVKPGQIVTIDGTGIVEWAEGTKLESLPIDMGDCGTIRGDWIVIDNDSALKAFTDAIPRYGNCARYAPPAIDFTRHTLVGIEVFADCNARIAIESRRDDVRRVYRMIIHETYGGCRGMRSHREWLLLPKLPQGYGVELPTALYERDDER